MLNAKTFICFDLGAGGFKAAEFDVTETGTLLLRQFGVKALRGSSGADAANDVRVIEGIKELMVERALTAKAANICASGANVFSKFVKLPPVDNSKVAQIIEYEAKQNVPFPLEEVVWDFQILGTAASGELEVLLVAIKRDIVENLFRISESSGLKLQLLDVSPAALCNAFRYSYGELDGCSMMLDIGAKTTNVLFFEKGKFFSRSINIGANSITQDFANESKLPFEEADRIKVEKGFVSLGGAYEEPDDPQAAAISKIARQVMTRLHIQVNQTIQFYRGQQGGSQPQRVFLAGGASVLPYTAQFFADKLNLPVEYFNPFRHVQLAPTVDVQELERVAHCYGEVVGLGLRSLAHCPLELNLMPKSSIQKQEMRRKQPFFIATILCVVLVVFAYGFLFRKLVGVKEVELANFQAKAGPLKQTESKLARQLRQLKETSAQADAVLGWVEDRNRWPVLLTELRRILLQTEVLARKPTSDAGLWIETMGPVSVTEQITGSAVPKPAMSSGDCCDPCCTSSCCDPSMVGPAVVLQPGGSAMQTRAGAQAPAAGSGTNEISVIKLTCRAVNMIKDSPSANSDLAFTFARELQKSPLFDPEGTQLSGTIEQVDVKALTFSFGVNLKLKQPIKR